MSAAPWSSPTGAAELKAAEVTGTEAAEGVVVSTSLTFTKSMLVANSVVVVLVVDEAIVVVVGLVVIVVVGEVVVAVASTAIASTSRCSSVSELSATEATPFVTL